MKITELNNNQKIHCQTEEEAKRILEICHYNGIKWFNDSCLYNLKWNIHKENTYYIISGERIYHGHINYAEKYHEIIPSIKIKNTLPKYYVIKNIGGELWKEYIEWLNEEFNHSFDGTSGGFYYGFNGYNYPAYGKKLKHVKNSPTEITLEYWKKCITPQQNLKNKIMNVTITKEEAQSIIDIACGTWKEKLFGLWGKQIVLNKPIEVTEEFHKEMVRASNPIQLHTIDSVFAAKKFKNEIDFNILNDKDVFYIETKYGSEWITKGKPFEVDEGNKTLDKSTKCRYTKEILCGKESVTTLRKATNEEIELFYTHFPKKQKIWIEVYRELNGGINMCKYESEEGYNDRWAQERTIDCIIREY